MEKIKSRKEPKPMPAGVVKLVWAGDRAYALSWENGRVTQRALRMPRRGRQLLPGVVLPFPAAQ